MTPWTIAHQTPLFMGFSRHEYWSGLPLTSPGDLPNPGIESASLALAGGFFTTEPPGSPETDLESLSAGLSKHPSWRSPHGRNCKVAIRS